MCVCESSTDRLEGEREVSMDRALRIGWSERERERGVQDRALRIGWRERERGVHGQSSTDRLERQTDRQTEKERERERERERCPWTELYR